MNMIIKANGHTVHVVHGAFNHCVCVVPFLYYLYFCTLSLKNEIQAYSPRAPKCVIILILVALFRLFLNNKTKKEEAVVFQIQGSLKSGNEKRIAVFFFFKDLVLKIDISEPCVFLVHSHSSASWIEFVNKRKLNEEEKKRKQKGITEVSNVHCRHTFLIKHSQTSRCF